METIDWANLSFGYMPTDYNVRYNYRNGSWGELEISSSEYINMHMAATCLHYGQEAFEGLKAFRGKDGKIRVFRLDLFERAVIHYGVIGVHRCRNEYELRCGIHAAYVDMLDDEAVFREVHVAVLRGHLYRGGKNI